MKNLVHTYISEAKLKGYKSIKELEIDLNPGLNIIIGKNGSGKTNFLSFLSMSIYHSFSNINIDFFSFIELSASNNKFYQFTSKTKSISFDDNLKNTLDGRSNENFETKINILDKEKKIIKTVNHSKNTELPNIIQKIIIKHGIPNGHLYLLEKSFSFNVVNKVSTEINAVLKDTETPSFLNSLLFLYNEFLRTYETYENREQFKANIDTFFNTNLKENLLLPLKKITDIQNIRINPYCSVNKIDENDFDVHNLFVEFLINDKWFSFSKLSDGLKRIFLIIADISLDNIKLNNKNEVTFTDKIILLEEPELGLHPHQLFQLMEYIKEESIEKQIIISTHAPAVLDHLNKIELDKIIICENKNSEGTKLKHLSVEDIKKAKHYMQDLDLSDYWRHKHF